MALFENPKLAGYVFNSLLNKVPFVDRDKQEERSYLGARAEGLNKFYKYPGAVEKILEDYDSGRYKNADEGHIEFLLSQRFDPGVYAALDRKKDNGKVLGETIQEQYTVPEIPQQNQEPLELEPIPGTKKFTNKDEVYYWTEAPVAQEVPQQALDFYSDYNYSGNGAFAQPLNPQGVQLLWNEIVQQTPGESYNNRVALLETLLGIAHAESHAGYDAGYIPDRNTNVWNVGYNANKDSVLKYDPTDMRETVDRVVNSAINDFGILKNQGLTDQAIHNYHIGPNAAYSQSGVDNYRGYIGGWESLYNPTYPWE